tara:strand:+ start:770 stop:1000 length:231 start_codon:yes stop_codon:yes gene_type:complete
MNHEKLTKKELIISVKELERELYLFKNRTQLARNYTIASNECDELREEMDDLREALEIAEEELREANLLIKQYLKE